MIEGALPDDVQQVLTVLGDTIVSSLGPHLVGLYLEGSFAWGDPVATSDIDLRVVTEIAATDEQRTSIMAAAAHAQNELGREVGVRFERLPDLIRVGAVRFQRAMPLAGRDIRSEVPLKPIDAFARDSLLNAHDLIVATRTRLGSQASFPIGAPAPGAALRGFDQQQVLDQGCWIPSSKRLVTVVTAIATALIARSARTYVFTKGEVARLYTTHIGDQWSGFVAAVHDECRVRDAYRLPADAAGKERLTALCDQAIAFENLLLALSIPTLLESSGSEVETIGSAARRRLETISIL